MHNKEPMNTKIQALLPLPGTGHYYDSSFQADYQKYTVPSWMEVTIYQKRLIYQEPVTYFCGGIYAGWVDAPEPGTAEI